MNSPEMTFWLQMAGVLALEITLVVLTVFMVQRWIRSGFWRRSLWQLGLILTLALTFSELSGLGRGAAVFLFGKAPSERKFTVEISPAVVEGTAISATQPYVLPVSEPMPAQAVQNSQWSLEVIWLIGIGVVLLRIAFAHSLFFVLRFRRAEIDDPNLTLRVAEFADRLGIRRTVRLLQSPGLSGPIAFGLFRPTIGLPTNFTSGFDRSQQDAMLAHELAHLAARDPLWYLLADLATALLCWHPLIWWARRRLHAASELAADEATLILENGPATLAECLLALGKQALQTRRWAIGVRGFESNLGQRVERLLALGKQSQQPIRRRSVLMGKAAMMASLAIGLILACGWIHGQDVTKAKTLQETLQKSWSSSAGGALMLAALENNLSGTPPVASSGEGAVVSNSSASLEAAAQEPPRAQKITMGVRYMEYDNDVAKKIGFDWLDRSVLPNLTKGKSPTNLCAAAFFHRNLAKL